MALTKETKHIINKTSLKLMKSTAVLINTGRGGHVNTPDLFQALKNKIIAGAAVDFIDDVKNHPILKLNNVVFSPHTAWFTHEAKEAMAETMIRNVEAFVKGKPINIIN
jgi:glycerate dehydrogenase